MKSIFEYMAMLERGDFSAYFFLSYIYSTGRETKKDNDLAFITLKKGLVKMFLSASMNLGFATYPEQASQLIKIKESTF